MRFNWKIISGLVATCFAIGMLLWAYNWHYRRYTWPAEIQTSLLGREIVDAGALLGQEGYSAYGEGMFRWRYKIDRKDSHLRELCGKQPLHTCRFTRTRRLSDGVVQTARYSDEVLVLEEIWS